MHNITLIGTAHREKGNCNSTGLYRIIEFLNPEVIFEEIAQQRFDDYYKKENYTTIESTTIFCNENSLLNEVYDATYNENTMP